MNKKCYVLILSAIMGIALLTSCRSMPHAVKQIEEPFFVMVLPGDFKIEKANPAEDFEVYTVSQSGEPYVGIYVGNQPDLPKESEWQKYDVKVLKSSSFESFSVWRKNQLIRREIVFRLQGTKGWPTYIHAWTYRLPQSKLENADKILSSIKVNSMSQPKHPRCQ